MTSACTILPLPSGKPYIQPKREIPAEEQITLEPELEEALAHATDAEMCDIAGGQQWEIEGGEIRQGVPFVAWDSGNSLNQDTDV